MEFKRGNKIGKKASFSRIIRIRIYVPVGKMTISITYYYYYLCLISCQKYKFITATMIINTLH